MEQSSVSIWARPDRSGRGPSPEYTRAQLAAEAVGVADVAGLSAVTMRSVARAVGGGPASLYRHVHSRDELVELMVDQVNGELSFDELRGVSWLDDLLTLAGQARGIYHRHPWLVEAASTGSHLGPNAVAYLERALAALATVDASGRTKLEAVGVLSGVVRLLAQQEIQQQQAGSRVEDWQHGIAAYLAGVVAGGDHPHLAAAMAPGAPDAGADPPTLLFERTVARVLVGLLAADPVVVPSHRRLLDGQGPPLRE